MPTLNGSEIIAIVAIVFGFFGTVIATVLSNRARRSEIVLDERLKALQAIYSASTKFNAAYKTLDSFVQDNDGDEVQHMDFLRNTSNSLTKVYAESKENFLTVYYDNRVFLPPSIDTLIQSYIKDVVMQRLGFVWYGDDGPEELFGHRNVIVIEVMERYEHRITEALHKFIGFK
jgi:hypothetical protein